MNAAMDTRQVSVRSGRLPVWAQAGELPALVLLHYWGGSRRTFAPVIAQLAAGCAVVSYDQRGWAQLAASRRPGGLAGLALIAPAPPRPGVDAQAGQALSQAYDSQATAIDALDHVLTHRPLPADLREQVISDSLAAGKEARLAWPLHGITQDITAAASRIEAPVLVLAGQHGQVEPPAVCCSLTSCRSSRAPG
jgi:pimeloyl-ACP methyl ester carboxylesterase